MDATEARKKGNSRVESSNLSEFNKVMSKIEDDVNSSNPRFQLRQDSLKEWTIQKLKDLGYSVIYEIIRDPREYESYHVISW